MPIYRASGLSASRRRRQAWQQAAAKSLATAKSAKKEDEKRENEKAREQTKKERGRSYSTGSRQKESKKQKVADASRKRAKSEGDVPTLRRDQRHKLNKMINEIYAADFTEDCGLLSLLLKYLEIKCEDLPNWQQDLFEAEVSSIKTTFTERADGF